jgi:hypothetical protein
MRSYAFCVDIYAKCVGHKSQRIVREVESEHAPLKNQIATRRPTTCAYRVDACWSEPRKITLASENQGRLWSCGKERARSYRHTLRWAAPLTFGRTVVPGREQDSVRQFSRTGPFRIWSDVIRGRLLSRFRQFGQSSSLPLRIRITERLRANRSRCRK